MYVELKKELENKMLMNPIAMEALEFTSRGAPENVAFCWGMVKLIDENEHFKTLVAECRRTIKIGNDLIATQGELIRVLEVKIKTMEKFILQTIKE